MEPTARALLEEWRCTIGLIRRISQPDVMMALAHVIGDFLITDMHMTPGQLSLPKPIAADRPIPRVQFRLLISWGSPLMTAQWNVL